MRGAGARKSHDNDRPLDFDVMNFWMAHEKIVGAKPGFRITNAVVVQDHAAEIRAIIIRIHFVEPNSEPFFPVVGPPAIKPGRFLGVGLDSGDGELNVEGVGVVDASLLDLGQDGVG